MQKSPFQLLKQRLISCKFNRNEKIDNYDLPINIKCNTQVNKHTNGNLAQVIFTISLFADDSFEDVPFTMELIHEGTFTWEDNLSQEQINTLLKINAPAILLSYDRSIISMITAYGDLPKVMIPLLNFYEPDNKKTNIQEK